MNSSAWDRFRKQQAAEREQLRRLLAGMQPLLIKCRDTVPNEIELAALAAMLHSFYTGLENIFKRAMIAAMIALFRARLRRFRLLFVAGCGISSVA